MIFRKKEKITEEIIEKMNGDEIYLLYKQNKIPNRLKTYALDCILLNECSFEIMKEVANEIGKISSISIISLLSEDRIKELFISLYLCGKEEYIFKIIKELEISEEIIKYIINFIIQVNKDINQLLSMPDSFRLIKIYKYMKLYNIEICRNLLVDEILEIGGNNIEQIFCEFNSTKELLDYLYKKDVSREDLNKMLFLYQKEKVLSKKLK